MLKISILGGTNEIGMNAYLYETEDSAIIVDYGVLFYNNEYIGVDFSFPNFDYINTIKHKLAGIIITHCHDDHTRGLSFLFSQVNVPIYTFGFTAYYLEVKLKLNAKINIVNAFEPVSIGDFVVEFMPVDHSTPHTAGIFINVNEINYFHISDFKIDLSNDFPFHKMRQTLQTAHTLRQRKVDYLLFDTTNAVLPSPTSHVNELVDKIASGDLSIAAKLEIEKMLSFNNESKIFDKLNKLFEELSSKRIFFTTFSSQIFRIYQFLQICVENNRKVCIIGNSLERIVELCRNMCYFNFPDDLFVTLKHAAHLPPNEITFLVTGCQAEHNSVLYSLSLGERKLVKFNSNDALIMSSRIIPGRERNVSNMLNRISKLGCEVYDEDHHEVHVSGHSSYLALAYFMHIVNPINTIPIHGDYRKQNVGAKLGEVLKINGSSYVLSPGEFITINEHGVATSTNAINDYGRLYYDARDNYVFSPQVLHERLKIALDGVFNANLFVEPIVAENGDNVHFSLVWSDFYGVGFKLQLDKFVNLIEREMHEILHTNYNNNITSDTTTDGNTALATEHISDYEKIAVAVDKLKEALMPLFKRCVRKVSTRRPSVVINVYTNLVRRDTTR